MLAEIAEYEKPALRTVESPAEFRVGPGPVHPVDQHRLGPTRIGHSKLFRRYLKRRYEGFDDLASLG